MVSVQSFSEWREACMADPDFDEAEDCSECDGWGEDGIGFDCGSCGGSGEAELTPRQYFSDVVGDIRKYCGYTGKDFLGEVGGFVKEFRAGQ